MSEPRSNSGAEWAAASLDREQRLGPQLARPSFVRYARRMTGFLLKGIEAVMKGRISVQGMHNLPSGPVLFVACAVGRISMWPTTSRAPRRSSCLT